MPAGLPADVGALRLSDADERGSAVVVGVGVLASAVISIGQSIVLTAVVGVGERTDAFLAAYSLFLPVALLGSTLRGQLIPLFGPLHPESGYRRRAAEICARATLLGAVLAVVLALLAPLAAAAVTRGLSPDAQHTAILILVILAPVAYMQFRAAALSALLAGARRFRRSVMVYVGSGVFGLGASALLLTMLGPVGAALGLAAGAGSLLLGHERAVRHYGLRLSTRLSWIRQRPQWLLSASLVGYAAFGLAQQLNLSVALAAVSSSPGNITVYTFAFLMVGVMLNVSSMALSLVLLPDLVERLARDGRRAAADHVVRVSRLAFVMLVPLLVAYLTAGRVLLQWALAPIFSAPSVDLLYELGRIFCVLAVPLALVQTVVSIVVALGRWRLTLAIAFAGVGLQCCAVTFLAGPSPQSIAWAHVGAVVATTALLLAAVFGDDVWSVGLRLARPLAAAVVLAAPVAVVTIAVNSAGPLILFTAVLAGFACYILLLKQFWADVLRAG